MQGYKTVKLVNGGETIVDESDFEWVSQFRWFKSSAGYAHRQGWTNRKHWCVFLHRVLNNTPDHLFTDHANGNKLDNRRSNLRTCTKGQNAANVCKWKKPSLLSEYKGVVFHKQSGLWMANIQFKGRKIATYHKTEQQAALDYNRMAVECFGEFAKLNNVPCGTIATVRRVKSSKYRGVSFHKRTERWRAALETGGKAVHLGAFSTEIEAAFCYNEGAKLHFGERAKLNEIHG